MSFEMPTSALPRCLVCGEPIDRIALYEIRGFEEPREQGGANKIVARERTGGVVGSCHAVAVKAGRIGQEALL